MSQFSQDLKDIVGIKDIENRLKALEEKAPIDPKRGLAYQVVSGAIKGASGTVGGSVIGVGTKNVVGSAESAAAKKANEDVAKAQEGKVYSDGGQKAAAQASELAARLVGNLAAQIFNDGDGVFGIEDLIGAANGIGGNIPDMGTGEILMGVTGLTDVATGIQYSIYEHPYQIPALDTSGDWTAGTSWTLVGTGNPTDPIGYTPTDAALNGQSVLDALYPSEAPHISTTLTPNDSGGLGPVHPDRYEAEFNRRVSGTFTLFVTANSCSIGTDDYCPATEPENLPKKYDRTVLYKNLNGQLVPGTGDNQASLIIPGLYNNEYGRSEIIGSFGAGGTRFFKRTPTRNGGFIYGEVTDDSYTGQKYLEDKNVLVFDIRGRLVAKPLGIDAKNYVNLDTPNI